MELLAPAGTFECILAAVNSGADAVYFAGQSFGARSYAGNLTDDEICKAADFCHIRGAKCYVTVNTLVYDREYKELEKFIKVITKAGVDAAIIQDLGVLGLIREMSPDIELHGSTQMTVHSADGVKALEKMGVSRVVLSRELSGEEIRNIIKNTSAEAEVFVHGAMCMSYSGQCLFSSVIGGRSGNRGKCAQPCRLLYSSGGEAKYYLSLKDMSLAEHIIELKKDGVTSLKIEGRMKGEAYVRNVVSTYRRLIDEDRLPSKEEVESLNRIFFRGGLTDGYYIGDKGPRMFAFDKPDNPYLKNVENNEKPQEKQIPVSISAVFEEGEKPHITISGAGHTAEAFGDEEVQTAAKRPATKDGIITQLVKTGGTAFRAEDIEVALSQNAFVHVSVINELRRKGIAALEEKILNKHRDKRLDEIKEIKKTNRKGRGIYTCSVLDIEQYRTVREFGFEHIYIPLSVVEKYKDELSQNAERIVISLPVIIREPMRHQYRERLLRLKDAGFSKAEIMTIDALEIAEGFDVFGGYRMNITNSRALCEAASMGIEYLCLSAEMNLPQVRDIEKNIKTEIIAYGKLPLMITENCILKNMKKCPCNGRGEMTDRTGATFPIVKDGDICRSVVLNSVPLYMGDRVEDLKNTGADYLRLMFTTEDKNECKEICVLYQKGGQAPGFEYTRLHYLKGALL